MALSKGFFILQNVLGECSGISRFYSSKVNFNKLRPMIQKRIEGRAKDYPISDMVPVAHEVLTARSVLIQGVCTLLQVFPISTCKFCSQVYIGENGHLIKSCHGYKRLGRNRVHEWICGSLTDVLVQVEAYHLQTKFQGVIKHQRRFDFDRVPAVVELCCQAGANLGDENLYLGEQNLDAVSSVVDGTKCLSPEDLMLIANGTLKAWETLRSGVKKLLLVYPSKVCTFCSEVHIGLSGHRAQLCGVFKYESWRGTHFWKHAEVDDLVPPNIVWSRRPQDPPILVDEAREFYGHAPAVVDLCARAGALVPKKYFCMMKVNGLSPHVS